MENNKKRNEAYVAFEYFLRVVKNHQLYFQVKRIISDFLTSHSLGNDTKGLIDLATKHSLETFYRHRKSNDKYELITIIVNFFIKIFLEEGGVNSRKLGMYGQEIFDLTCYALYGDAYLDDMDSMNGDAPRPTNDYEAFLVAEYMMRKQKDPNITYQQVVDMHKNDDMSQWNRENYEDDNWRNDFNFDFYENEDEYHDDDDEYEDLTDYDEGNDWRD